MERFPWRFAVYLVAGLYLFADMAVWQGPVHQRLTRPWADAAEAEAEQVAMVYGRPVTRLELAEALREYLWKRGEDWRELSEPARKAARWLVLENLVNDRVIHAFRVMNRLRQPLPDEPVEREVEMLRRQFTTQEDWQRRLTWQARSEADFAHEARAALEDGLWIEEKIRHRLAEITDELVREWYEANAEQLTIPTSYRAAHCYLTVHDESKPERQAEMAAIAERVRSGGQTFEAAVLAFSEDERTKRRGGDLGWFNAERMPADFMAAVKAQTVGEVGPVVRTALGWHLIRVTATAPARVPSFEEVAAEIRAMLETERRRQAVQALIAELRERSIRPTRFIHYEAAVIDAVEPAATGSSAAGK
jgi:hypothetical protein